MPLLYPLNPVFCSVAPKHPITPARDREVLVGVALSSGVSPRLIINTTLYNSGRRFVLTTLPPEAARYDFYRDLRAALARQGQTPEFPPAFLQRWEKLLSVTPRDLGINPCHVRLASAVSGSASFPPSGRANDLPGRRGGAHWHMGDGGLYENQGIESLLFVFLKQLQKQTARRALIIAFDSSFPFNVGERPLTRRAQSFSLWNYDYTRIPSIMEQRASTYQALFIRGAPSPEHLNATALCLNR